MTSERKDRISSPSFVFFEKRGVERGTPSPHGFQHRQEMLELTLHLDLDKGTGLWGQAEMRLLGERDIEREALTITRRGFL